MMPPHASLPLVDLERMLCRTLGHRAIVEDVAVSTFFVCLRCGRFWR